MEPSFWGKLFCNFTKKPISWTLQSTIFVTVLGENLKRNWILKFDRKRSVLNFHVVLLVSDLPATASMLNMHNHLATCGCTFCLIETKLNEKTRFYPLKQTSMTTPDVHQKCINIVERRNFTAFKGVKGRSKFFNIIPNSPLAAPIDVMHPVYLGVLKALLHAKVSNTVKTDIEYINNIALSLKVNCIFI